MNYSITEYNYTYHYMVIDSKYVRVTLSYIVVCSFLFCVVIGSWTISYIFIVHCVYSLFVVTSYYLANNTLTLLNEI